MIEKLEQIKELINPLENRIKFVESDTNFKALGYSLLGSILSFARGAIVGYTIGALTSGFNEKYSFMGAIIGAVTDGTHDTIRKINWISMRVNNLKDYQEHVRKFKRSLKINYGKYAS